MSLNVFICGCICTVLCCDACCMLFSHDFSLAHLMKSALLNGCSALSLDPFPLPLLSAAVLERWNYVLFFLYFALLHLNIYIQIMNSLGRTLWKVGRGNLIDESFWR